MIKVWLTVGFYARQPCGLPLNRIVRNAAGHSSGGLPPTLLFFSSPTHDSLANNVFSHPLRHGSPGVAGYAGRATLGARSGRADCQAHYERLQACLGLANPELPEWCDRWQITCRLRTSSALKVWLTGFRWEVMVDRRFEMRASRERREERREWQRAREARHFESGLAQANPHRKPDLETVRPVTSTSGSAGLAAVHGACPKLAPAAPKFHVPDIAISARPLLALSAILSDLSPAITHLLTRLASRSCDELQTGRESGSFGYPQFPRRVLLHHHPLTPQ